MSDREFELTLQALEKQAALEAALAQEQEQSEETTLSVANDSRSARSSSRRITPSKGRRSAKARVETVDHAEKSLSSSSTVVEYENQTESETESESESDATSSTYMGLNPSRILDSQNATEDDDDDVTDEEEEVDDDEEEESEFEFDIVEL